LYNEALKVNNLNLDSYDYKIQMYKALKKTSAEWHQLALDIIDNYTFYPMAMGDLMNLIKPYLNGVDRVDIDQKYYDALVRAKGAKATDIWQTTAAQQIASARLSSASNQLASFSFNGANAGKIVLSKAYDSFTDLMWKYSLDGGVTKSKGTLDHALKLSEEEIAKINDVNDIQLYIVGLNESKPVYTIDIVKGSISSTLYGNDLENRVVGVDITYEWRLNETDEWTSYAEYSPDCTGDKTLYVRNGGVGNALPSESKTFKFTNDNQPDTRKYITSAQLSIAEYYTQSKDSKRPFYAPNAIDANINTMWHTDFALDVRNDKEKKPFITIKLEHPKYISAVEFIQTKYKANDPDYIKNARIYVSEEIGEGKENWILAGQITNCPQDSALRVINFEESIYGQYVKIEMDTYSMFASIAMVNIFKDVTKQEEIVPTAAIGYNIETKTNKDVVARLVNSSEPVTVTNGSDTHVFTKNGSYTFKFVNANGVEGTATATVDWIDKTAPTAKIEYSTKDKTNKSVIATLKPDEDVIVTDNGDFTVDDEGHVLDKNGVILEGYTV
ncbi:MAG: discoidin domain-containing protein, partial [Bacilli bacterium]|nr:discoidin domain-containing protein [Bacilli bacterium]